MCSQRYLELHGSLEPPYESTFSMSILLFVQSNVGVV